MVNARMDEAHHGEVGDHCASKLQLSLDLRQSCFGLVVLVRGDIRPLDDRRRKVGVARTVLLE